MPQSLFDKVAETLAQVFSCEFCEISESTLFTEHIRETVSKIIINKYQILNERHGVHCITILRVR